MMDNEKITLRNELYQALTTNQANLQNGNAPKDIERNLRAYLQNIPIYSNEITRLNNAYQIPIQNPPNLQNPQAYRAYTDRLNSHETAIRELNRDVKEVIDDVLTIVTEVFNTTELYDRFSSAHGIQNMNQWWDGAVNDIISNPRHKTIHTQALTNDELSKIYRDLTGQTQGIPAVITPPVDQQGALLHGADLRNYLFSNMNNSTTIRNALEPYKDTSALWNNASTELSTKVTDTTNGLNQIKTEYEGLYKELSKYVNPQATDLNESIQNIFGLLGQEILTEETALDNEPEFRTIANAYMGDYFAKRYGGNADYLNASLNGINNSFNNQQTTLAQKRAHLEDVKKLKAEADKANTSSLKIAKREIKRWYRYVMLDAVQFDNPENHTGEYTWSMFNASGQIVENHDTNTNGGAGLGLFNNLLDDLYIENITNGTYENIKALKKGIVTKHKKSSPIGVDEILLWGFYNAIDKSHRANIRDEIRNRWNAVMRLDDTSTLRQIRYTYDLAADLGDELNDDVKVWTNRKKEGYVDLDNEVNKASGMLYAAVDAAEDRLKWFLKQLKVKEPKESQTTSTIEPYDVDITAIKPKTHVIAKGILGILVLPYLAYKIGKGALEVITNEEDREKGLTELGENISIALGSGLITKYLST